MLTMHQTWEPALLELPWTGKCSWGMLFAPYKSQSKIFDAVLRSSLEQSICRQVGRAFGRPAAKWTWWKWQQCKNVKELRSLKAPRKTGRTALMRWDIQGDLPLEKYVECICMINKWLNWYKPSAVEYSIHKLNWKVFSTNLGALILCKYIMQGEDDLQDVGNILIAMKKIAKGVQERHEFIKFKKGQQSKNDKSNLQLNPRTLASPLAWATHSRIHAESMRASMSGKTSPITQTTTNIRQMAASWANPNLVPKNRQHEWQKEQKEN